ncbi:hypothetical protein ACFX13_007766 [Malus domestica]
MHGCKSATARALPWKAVFASLEAYIASLPSLINAAIEEAINKAFATKLPAYSESFVASCNLKAPGKASLPLSPSIIMYLVRLNCFSYLDPSRFWRSPIAAYSVNNPSQFRSTTALVIDDNFITHKDSEPRRAGCNEVLRNCISLLAMEAASELLKLMGLLMTNNGGVGIVRVVQSACAIGEAIENEVCELTILNRKVAMVLRKLLPAAFSINSSSQFYLDIRRQLKNDSICGK